MPGCLSVRDRRCSVDGAGRKEIAVATSKLMEQYDVAIWAHHGMFCAGEDFDLTFGLMHTVEKSAEILVKVLSMGSGKSGRQFNRMIFAVWQRTSM